MRNTGGGIKLREEERSNHTVLRLEGSLKAGESARAFQERVEKIASERKGALILVLSRLEFLDSTGEGLLVAALRRFHGIGRDFFLVGPRRRVLTGLRVTHLDSLFSIYPTLEGALTVLARKEQEETGGQ